MELVLHERDDNISHVALRGQLDVHGLHKVDADFYNATSGMDRPAIVDLSDLEFIASLGIGMLYACARSLANKGHRMAILRPSRLVADTLRRAHIDSVVPVVDSLDEAVKKLSSR